jgi:hypothetical protein
VSKPANAIIKPATRVAAIRSNAMRGLLLLVLVVAIVGAVGGAPAVGYLWCLVALVGVVGGLFYGSFYHRKIVGDLFSDLTNMPLPVVRCPQCGHNLDSYSEGDCPTCGLAFRIVDE